MLCFDVPDLKLANLLPPQIVAQINSPGFFCRKHTITTYVDQPLLKVDAVNVAPATAGPLSEGYQVWILTKQSEDKQLCVLDAHRGTFRRAEATLPGGRAHATIVINQEERKRIWISTLVSAGVGASSHIYMTLLSYSYMYNIHYPITPHPSHCTLHHHSSVALL